MKNIEELLKKKKEYYDELEAPEEMEMRLTNVLSQEKTKKTQWKKISIIASLIFVFLFTYNYNTLAFYGKKLLGYDTVMSQTLQDLNELGKGQEIGEKVSFENGVELTLDGIMVDDNQLLAFYRIKNPHATKDDVSFNIFSLRIRGLFKEYMPSSGQGEFKEESRELIMVHSFEPPAFYEKKLKFQGHFEANGQEQEFNISFPLDRDKAMGHSIKQNINKTISLDKQEVAFKNIIATQTQTVVKGSLGSLLDLALEQISSEQVRPGIEVDLIANGEVIELLGSGLSTSMKGIKFEHRFDALPKDLEDLKLQIKNLTIDKKIDEIFAIQRKERKQIEVEGQEIEILQIGESIDGRTEITIESEESVLLPGVELILDGKTIPLEMTHSEEYRKTHKGILKRRVLSFKGVGKELQLKLNRIYYKKEFNKTIEIPVK